MNSQNFLKNIIYGIKYLASLMKTIIGSRHIYFNNKLKNIFKKLIPPLPPWSNTIV